MSEMITLSLPAAALERSSQSGDRTVEATEFDAYIAEPTGTPRGALIVIHEVWGLVDNIKDIANRFAAEGYLVLAPDLLSSVGIDAQIGFELSAIMKSPDERVRSEGQPRLREAFAALRVPEFASWALAALESSVDYLEARPGIDGRIAVTGFCFGGTYSFALAAADPRILAAVPFYGAPPESTIVSQIACPVLAFYGETDTNLIESLPQVTESMTAAGVNFVAKVYEDAGHAFFNDTNAFMYRADAAADSWRRTLEFLDSNLAS